MLLIIVYLFHYFIQLRITIITWESVKKIAPKQKCSTSLKQFLK